MLRITRTSEGPSDITLKLEGTVVSNWVPLLREECLRVLKEKKRVWLDFSDVTFVDDRGVEMLKAVVAEGVKLLNCSPLVGSLLQEEGANECPDSSSIQGTRITV
jgi:anti-anti-sigma regulatory factor